MSVKERLQDIPTLRFLHAAGGHLSTTQLHEQLDDYFKRPIGQLNVISNMEGGNSLISRGLVNRQIDFGNRGEWIDYNRHLEKEQAHLPQRLAITERGRLLLAGISDAQDTIPSNFDALIADQAALVQEHAETVRDALPQSDDADRDVAPPESDISREPPRAPTPGENRNDPEARTQALARRVSGHHALVLAIKEKAAAAGLAVKQTRYADALMRTASFGAIFEMKTVSKNGRTDLIHQLRGAIAQLYHYRFIHRKSPGFEHDVKLYAVFDAAVPDGLVAFLREINIGTISHIDGSFVADEVTQAELPWICRTAGAAAS